MEGSRRNQTRIPDSPGSDRGRDAEHPGEIPAKGWRDVLLRTRDNLQHDNVSLLAAGTAFYLLLALVPASAALISIYGVFSNPAQIQAQVAALREVVPGEVQTIIQQQLTQIAGNQNQAGIAALISIVLALWGASAGIKTLMTALNIVYGEEEKRSFIRRTALALGLTLGAIVLGVISVGLIVALPPLLAKMGLGDGTQRLGSILRWPFLCIVAMVGLAVLYRYAPSREKPQWKWVSTGALVATLLWLAASLLFSFYAGHFGNYNKTYGSLAAVIVLMLWLYLSAFAVLLGAEIEAEAEHQTAKDTTSGPPEPMGRRGAYVADTLGEKK